MNLNLLKNSLKERWLSSLTFAVGLFFYCWTIVAILPMMLVGPTMVEFEKILSQFPKELLSLLAGGGIDISQFFTVEGFVSFELFSLWWIIIVGGFAINLALGIVAKDTSEGTIELLMSNPLKRETIVITRLISSSLILFFLAFFTTYVFKLFCIFNDISLSFIVLTIVGLYGWLFFEVILLFTFFLTIVLKEGGKATLFSFLFLLSSHILNALGSMHKIIDSFRPLSIFYYYNPAQYLIEKKIDFTHLAIFLVVIFSLFTLSLLIYRKKDIYIV